MVFNERYDVLEKQDSGGELQDSLLSSSDVELDSLIEPSSRTRSVWSSATFWKITSLTLFVTLLMVLFLHGTVSSTPFGSYEDGFETDIGESQSNSSTIGCLL